MSRSPALFVLLHTSSAALWHMYYYCHKHLHTDVSNEVTCELIQQTGHCGLGVVGRGAERSCAAASMFTAQIRVSAPRPGTGKALRSNPCAVTLLLPQVIANDILQFSNLINCVSCTIQKVSRALIIKDFSHAD